MLSMVQISQGHINHPQVDEQWDLVGSLTIWFIWKQGSLREHKGTSRGDGHEDLTGNHPHLTDNIMQYEEHQIRP